MNQMDEAVQKYRVAYEKVEQLRQVIPGVRLIQPPSQSVSREIMEENDAAAYQFLGIRTDAFQEKQQQQQQTTMKSNTESLQTEGKLTTLQKLILGLIVLSQISLLFFFIVDPMSSTNNDNSMSGMNNNNNAVGALFDYIDTISGGIE